MGKLFLINLRNLPFLCTEGDVLMTHQQGGGKVGEHATGSKQRPDDINGKAGIGRK